MHGDRFDVCLRNARWLAHLGDRAYRLCLIVNTWFNRLRRRLGYGYWSLSAYLKQKVKNAVSYIGEYEKALVADAKKHNVQGIVCGHIHHATIHDDLGVTYVNCGDWVERCTAIAEHHDGRLEIIHWTVERNTGELHYIGEPQAA